MSETYKVYLSQSYSQVVEVEADDPESAIEAAHFAADWNLCHQEVVEQDGEAEALIVYNVDDNEVWNARDDAEGV